MSSQRTNIKAGDSEPPRAAAERSIADDLPGELQAVLEGDLARQVRYWRARAEELAGQIERLQERLLALTNHLPARYARLLTCDPAALEHETDWPDPLADWKETTFLEPASVARELSRLWKRLGSLPPR